MTTLHPAAIHVLRMPGWKVRVWLAVVITLALAGLPPPAAGVVLWVLALAYLTMTETLARMVMEKHKALREAVEECERHGPRLAERDAQIAVLEADLAQARIGPVPRTETVEEALYRQVGLHPCAPEFLVLAARRAFRTALHPDRHPRHRAQAHDRFVRAEATFERIASNRRC